MSFDGLNISAGIKLSADILLCDILAHTDKMSRDKMAYLENYITLC